MAAATPNPNRHWFVDEVGDRCKMSRALSGSLPVIMTVQTYPGSQSYDVLFESSSWPVKQPLTQTHSRIELKPPLRNGWYLTQIESALWGAGTALKMVQLPGSFLLDLSKASTLVLSNWQLRPQTFSIPRGADEAIRALIDCQVSKMIEWGADPSGFGSGALPPRPQGSVSDWLGVDLFRQMKSHRVAVRMLVSPGGKVEQCTFLKSNLGSDAEAEARRSMSKHARFRPARGPNGSNVRSVFVLYFNLEKYDRWEYLPAG